MYVYYIVNLHPEMSLVPMNPSPDGIRLVAYLHEVE